MRLALFLAALLLAAPAHAGTDAEMARIDACLAASPGEGGACIRQIFRDCVEAAPARDTIMGWKETDIECGAREQAAWDVILNRDYRALRARIGEFSDTAPDALRDAQRKWIAFRDADCAWPLDFLRGNDAHHQSVQCPLETTAERAIELNQWLEVLK